MDIDQTFNEGLPSDCSDENLNAAKFAVPDMVPRSTGNGHAFKDERLPLFSGDKNTISFIEWWQRFVALSQALGWSIEDQARRLPGMVTKRAFQVVSKLLVEHLAPNEKIEIIRLTLQKSFGLSPEKAFAAFCSRNFDSSKEDIDAYASDLVHLLTICFPTWTPAHRDEIAVKAFWRGLPACDNRKQLYAVFKREQQSQTLADALDVCRDGFEEEPQVHHYVPRTETYPNRGKGKGKGRWRPPHVHKTLDKRKNFRNSFETCLTCGGRGHSAAVCPTARQVCTSDLLIIKCLFTGKCFIVDTGASVSVVKAQSNELDSTLVRTVSTINGLKVLNEVRDMTIMGVHLDKCLAQVDFPTVVNGINIDGILGMDYIRAVGGITVSVTNNGKAQVSFNRPSINLITLDLDQHKQPETRISSTEMADFILEKHHRNDPNHPEWKYKWIVKWKWIGEPNSHYGPPSYNYHNLTEEHRTLMTKEIESWSENNFIVDLPPDERNKVKGLISIKAVEQLHKPSTPVRPVLDYTWLNKQIHSFPNEDVDDPLSAPLCIRRWRSHASASMCLIDIKKAYLQIFVDENQSYYQCIRFPSKDNVYRLTRLGFGISIAPKVLRVILSQILPEEIFPNIDTYIDDNFIPLTDVYRVRSILREHGFETKEPEPVLTSRVLGLQNYPDGTWRRRTDLPKLEKFSKRGVHSWTGKLVSHLPIAGWLRPCVSALKRLCSSNFWDDELPSNAINSCKKLENMIFARGDPCTGSWHYDKHKPWTLYTDASLAAYGAVLMIGNVYVEDQTYLRSPSDRRHINLAELIAVQKGLHLVSLYQKALKIDHSFVLQLKCDNKSVVSWLTRAKERHWTSIKGLNAKVIEKTLLQIADDCKALKLRLEVELIPSEQNLSDPLSRIPDFLKAPEEPFDGSEVEAVVCTTIEQTTPAVERDEFNRVIVDQRTLRELLKSMHEHEGAQALYNRVRLIVSYPSLRKECQTFVRNCALCSLSKVTRHTPILAGDAHMEEALSPFSHVHLDIAGPYGSLDDLDHFYVLSLMDRHSRFVLTKSTCSPPTAMDAAALLRITFERFHVCVDVVHTDGGRQFISAEFARAAMDVGARVQTTPVRSSWANGRVERWHRVLNDRLRAFLGDGVESNCFRLFDKCVARATLVYNTAPSTRSGTSPHETLFTFDAWIYPQLLHYRPPPSLSLDMSETDPPPPHPHSRERLPVVGETWLYRLPNPRKLEWPYAPCRIIHKHSTQTYRVKLRGKRLKKVHIRFLKILTPEAAADLPVSAQLPEDTRPLRDLSGGGGHVEN